MLSKNQNSLEWIWNILHKRMLLALKIDSTLKSFVLYKVSRPPKAPSESEASPLIMLLNSMFLKESFFIFVSWIIKISGLWSLIKFLMISCLWAPFRPLIFHEMIFIFYSWKSPSGCFGTHSPNTFWSPLLWTPFLISCLLWL